MTERIDDDTELALSMRQLLYGQLVSRALCALAVLDIPNLLAERAQSAADLAAKSGAHELSLQQLLRALVPFGVLVEHDDATFGLTRLGATLRSDATASALPTALLVHDEVGAAWGDLVTTVQRGEPAFRAAFGVDFFQYLDENPSLRATFHRSQQHGLAMDLSAILKQIDFGPFHTVVDVGGGDGALLAAILVHQPHLRGVLVDLPAMTAEAGLRLTTAGLAHRVELCPGDFLRELPTGGDLYLMRQITHDLDDERCVALFRACRRAMNSDSTLLILDLTADARPGSDAAAQMTAIMNLYMMSIFGGRERTLAELDALLLAAGFTTTVTTRLTGQMTAVMARPVG